MVRMRAGVLVVGFLLLAAGAHAQLRGHGGPVRSLVIGARRQDRDLRPASTPR